MDDDLQVVDDVIEIQDDDDDDLNQLEVSDQIDFTQDDSSMADDNHGDEIYLEQSNTDFPLEDDDDRYAVEEKASNNASANVVEEEKSDDHKQSSTQSKSTELKDDFDDAEYDTEEETCAENEFTDEAEDYEKEFLNMPALHTVLNDLGSLKQGRRLIAQPLKMEELSHPVVVEIFGKLSSEDIKIQFVRSKDNSTEWKGFLLMHFSSCLAAKEAAEKLKTIRDDIEVKAQNETAYASKIMEQWIKDEKGQKKWTDALVLVKSVPEDVKVEQIQELFPDSEDILILKSHDRNREKVKDAYVMFHDKERAEQVTREMQSTGVELDGVKLRVFKYHVPQESGVKGLLKLSQRKMLLKYVERLDAETEKESQDESYKAPSWCRKRLEICRSTLERDDKIRKILGLPAPSCEELTSMKVKSLRGGSRKDALIRVGVIERHQRKQNYYNPSSNRSGSRGGMSSINRSRGYDSRHFSSNNRRSESLLGNPPSLTSMGPIVPPLLALQRNAGMMRMMMAQQQRSLEGSNMRRGGREPPAKLLRMDEKGIYHNYRPQSGSGGQSRGRGDKRPVSLLDL